MTEQRRIRIEQHVDSTPAEVFRAFTGRLPLRMWLCTDAQVDPRSEGRIFLWWGDGYYVAGEFTEIEPGVRIAWRWRGRGEPGPTDVVATLLPAGDGANVLVEHSGFGVAEPWNAPFEAARRRWAEGLENLASVWGMTGIDLRVARRPLLGIYLGGFVDGPEGGLPAGTRGIGVTGTLEDSGAEACGLRRGDVVTELNGVALREFDDFGPAMDGKRAGDTVSMTYYRDGERVETPLTFSARPAPPDVPSESAGLATIIEEQYAGFAAELDGILADVTEEEAPVRPTENGWSVKEILAHLVLFERCFQQWLSMYVEGDELREFAATVRGRVEGLVERFPSVRDLVVELTGCRAETVSLLRGLPEEFTARPEYVRMGQIMIEEAIHSTLHHGQMQRTIAAIRSEA